MSDLCATCGTATVHGWLLQCDACFTAKWVRLGVLPKPKSNATRGSVEQLTFFDQSQSSHVDRWAPGTNTTNTTGLAGTAVAEQLSLLDGPRPISGVLERWVEDLWTSRRVNSTRGTAAA